MYKNLEVIRINGKRRKGGALIGMFTNSGKILVGLVLIVILSVFILFSMASLQAASTGHSGTIFYGRDVVKFVEHELAAHKQPTDLEIRRTLERQKE